MKFNTLFVAGVCASALFASCNPQTAKENQLKYTHTSLADGDAFQFFQVVGGKVVYEADYAAYVETVATSSQAKQLAAKVKEVYAGIIPTLDSLAVVNQIDFPIKGAAVFAKPETATVEHVHATDSASTEHAAAGHAHGATYSDAEYLHHVQHETAKIKDQFERLSHNTNKGLRTFAKENLEKVAELFTLAGGKEDAHTHH